MKIVCFNVWVRYFEWNFKGTLWNSTQNILPIHWKIFWEYVVHDSKNPHRLQEINSLRPRQNDRYFPDDIFKWIFLNENVWISINISLKFVPRGPINNIRALVQIMAWRRSGDKPLSEPMVVRLPMHICVTRPQWVNSNIVTCSKVS